MKNVICGGLVYQYTERFDSNLTAEYENDWNEWHVMREIISNSIDSVGGDVSNVSITSDSEFITVTDKGPGYPVVYAKRIGASSKKMDNGAIGQFGEGLKMAALTCLRKGIAVRIGSQSWLIEPVLVPAEEGIEVLMFDIYESDAAVDGSFVSVKSTPEFREIIDRLGEYFLQFSLVEPLSGTMSSGIYPAEGNARVFNKGVYIKDINAMFSYGISISELNRDRDLINDDILCRKVRDIWEQVECPKLIKAYFTESNRNGIAVSTSQYKEFSYSLYLHEKYCDAWIKVFRDLFGEKAVIYTSDLAATEAVCLGYSPVRLDYYGKHVAEHIGILKDLDVCRADYEYTWADILTAQEAQRLSFFRQVADMMEMECPDIKVFETYAKSDYVTGCYNHTKDEIYLKREILAQDICVGLSVFLHELTHRHTGADDYTREFANGLSTLASKLALRLTGEVGLPMCLKLTDRGFELPSSFTFSADSLTASVAIVANFIVIRASGNILKSSLNGVSLKPYSTIRQVTFYKGRFYVNVPAFAREHLPAEVVFNVARDIA